MCKTNRTFIQSNLQYEETFNPFGQIQNQWLDSWEGEIIISINPRVQRIGIICYIFLLICLHNLNSAGYRCLIQ